MSDNMLPHDFQHMLEQGLETPKRGSIIKGTVSKVDKSTVFVSFGYKTEGVLSITELEDQNVEVGMEIDASVISVSGDTVKLSRKALIEPRKWQELLEAHENNSPVEVFVTDKSTRGYFGLYGDVVKVFIPNSHSIPDMVSKKISTYILSVDENRRDIVASPKQYKNAIKEEEKKKFFETRKIGDIITSKVTSIVSYGVFVNLGPLDGFIHKSNIDWGRVFTPSKYFAAGDEIKVKIIGLNPEEGKVELSYKDLKQNPWVEALETIKTGDTVKVKIVTKKRQGYIGEITNGVDVLLPFSEVSWTSSYSEIKFNSEIETLVMDVDEANSRFLVSYKQLQDNPWDKFIDDHPAGTLVTGKIVDINNYGLLVECQEGFVGLVHKSEISWVANPENLSDDYKVGDTVEAKVLNINPDKGRISLSIKQLESDPWTDLEKSRNTGTPVKLTITNDTAGTLTMAFDSNITGTMQKNDRSAGADTDYNVGQTIEAVITFIDRAGGTFSASQKKLDRISERKAVESYNKAVKDDSQKFGNVFEQLLSNDQADK